MMSMDSKMDVDVGKPAQPHGLSPVTDAQSIPTLDGWIESLMDCKQLAEADVSRLCDRVSKDYKEVRADEKADTGLRRLGKCYKKSPMCSQW